MRARGVDRRRLRVAPEEHPFPPGDTRSLESAARAWLLRRGVPCWTCPAGPGTRGRYGLLLHGGRRVLVGPWPIPGFSLEEMIQARCDFLLAVSGEGGDARPAGFVTLADIAGTSQPWTRPDLSASGSRPPEDLPAMVGRPSRPGPAFLAGSLRLLLLGEPPPPPPGDWSGLEPLQPVPAATQSPGQDAAISSDIPLSP